MNLTFLLVKRKKTLDEVLLNERSKILRGIGSVYAIKNHINSLKNKIQDHSIDLISLNPIDSRQAIVSRFKNNKEIENLLRNILILSNQA